MTETTKKPPDLFWALGQLALWSFALYGGFSLVSHAITRPDFHEKPTEYAEVMLKESLVKEGYLPSGVVCHQFTSLLEPLCEASLQPKTGGPVSGPLRYRGNVKIVWESY